MFLELLPNELLVQVMHSCDSVRDTLNLASTCRRLQQMLASRRVSMLAGAAERQYGPVQEAVQVVTYNASQPAHAVRSVPWSMALLKQVAKVGAVAQKWIEVFPRRKWKGADDWASRRLLTPDEEYRVRRAVYRLWLYGKAFHNSRYRRTVRMHVQHVRERAELLHNWTSDELAELEDVRRVIRDELSSQVCPSNGTIQRRFRKRHPDSLHHQHQQLLFNCNVHVNYPAASPTSFCGGERNNGGGGHFSYAAALQQQQQYSKPSSAQISAWSTWKFSSGWHGHNAGDEGWGDDIPHYYVVEDMLKLDPGEIMFLRENAPLKGMVELYIKTHHGEWFENNGETFGPTLAWVLAERGEELGDMKDGIDDRQCGIIVE